MPYINLTNNDGLFDTTTRTRATFKTYITCHFDQDNPTEYNEQVAVATLAHRRRLYGKVRMTILAQSHPRLIHLLHRYPSVIPNPTVTEDAAAL